MPGICLAKNLTKRRTNSLQFAEQILYKTPKNHKIGSVADYKLRIVDLILQERLEAKGAVLIEGAKWCGKTTIAVQKAASVLRMDRRMADVCRFE